MKNTNGQSTNTSKKLTPVSTLGEFGLIKHLTQNIRLKHASSIKGVGDDAAVIQSPADQQTVISTDLLIEGIHFDMAYTPLQHLGYKSVVVNLSDIYAMNATPQQITLAIGISSRFTVEALDEFYKGVRRACDFYNVDLIGGDTTSSNKGLIINITAIGTAPAKEIVYRSGAKEGDLIVVSGDLGAAYLGLQLLEREKQIFLEHPDVQPELKFPYVLERFLKPEARQDLISQFKRHRIQPTSMIDISDGLSSELLHICEASKVGCAVYEENIPINSEAQQLALQFKVSPTTCALSGGEDYELLFTIDPKHREVLEDLADIGVKIIGQIQALENGRKLYTRDNNYDLIAQGWKHL